MRRYGRRRRAVAHDDERKCPSTGAGHAVPYVDDGSTRRPGPGVGPSAPRRRASASNCTGRHAGENHDNFDESDGGVAGPPATTGDVGVARTQVPEFATV